MKITSLQSYQDLAIITRQYPVQYCIAYPCLGLLGEITEAMECTFYNEDALKKEIGDVFWYIAVLCYDIGIRMDNIEKESSTITMKEITSLTIIGGRIAECVKKILRDGISDSKIERMKELIGQLIFGLGSVWKFDMMEVLEMNIKKLYDRRDRGVIKGNGNER